MIRTFLSQRNAHNNRIYASMLFSFSSYSAILDHSLALNSFLCCMKKIFLLFFLISVTLFSFSQPDSAKKSSSHNQQEDVTLPPYKRFPTVPPLKLLLLDSTSYFTKNDLKKNKPVLIPPLKHTAPFRRLDDIQNRIRIKGLNIQHHLCRIKKFKYTSFHHLPSFVNNQ